MIIFKAGKRVFCILDNPKCGSTTLRTVIYTQIRKKYKVLFNSSKNVHMSGYNHPQYIHCNIEAAVIYCKSQNINPSDVIYITTIRHPIERMKSNYFYYLQMHNVNKWKYDNRSKDIGDFVDRKHIQQFYPENFRYFKDYTTTEVIRLESIKEDLTNLFHKYKLDISTEKICVLNSTKKKEDMEILEDVKKKIMEKFKLDVITGNYSCIIQLNYFDYILDRIKDSEIIKDPFPHLEIENFLNEEDLEVILQDKQIHFDVVESDDKLFQTLINKKFKVQSFPGCTNSWDVYKSYLNKPYNDNYGNPVEGVGMAFRLTCYNNPFIKKLIHFMNGNKFKQVLEEKFQVTEKTTVISAIQKYLNKYEISPHPDVRKKCLTYLVNINN